MVRLSGAFGRTLNVTSVNTERVPQEPLKPRTRSTPVTFFMTRPPDLIAAPSPFTARKPSMWSRAAPRKMRRGPEMLMAAMAPMLAASGSVP